MQQQGYQMMQMQQQGNQMMPMQQQGNQMTPMQQQGNQMTPMQQQGNQMMPMQQGTTGGFDAFNQAFKQQQQQQQQQQKQQHMQQQQYEQQFQQQQSAQEPVRTLPPKSPPSLVQYSDYFRNDLVRPVSINVLASYLDNPMNFSGNMKLSPKVVYDSVGSLIAKEKDKEKHKRTTDRFTTGNCLGTSDKKLKVPVDGTRGFYSVCLDVVFGNRSGEGFKIEREAYDSFMATLNLNDSKIDDFPNIAMGCGAAFNGLFECMTLDNVRATKNYLYYLAEGMERQSLISFQLFHVMSDYEKEKPEEGKTYTIKHPISCTNDPNAIIRQARKHGKYTVLKFVGFLSRVMPSGLNATGSEQFNEAVILPGCKVKVEKIFDTVEGNLKFKFIELTPVDAKWTGKDLFH